MRTLFVLPDLFRADGGIARVMRLYVKAVGQDCAPGDKVDVVPLLDEGDTLPRVRGLLGPALGNLDNCAGSRLRFGALTLWRSLDADRLICGHVFHLILARLARLARPRLKYYLVAHGIDVWRNYSLPERIALLGAERIFCVSEFTRRQMLRYEPRLDPARLIVVPNSFDPVVGEKSAVEADAPRTVHPRILIVSRLLSTDPYKGVDLMIEAMPQIRAEFPTVQLRIVGSGDDAPRLRGLAEQHGVANTVHFAGRVDDATLEREYAACDLFALPSRKEGFGVAYLEAMAHGKPCLAARAGGAPEVVGDRGAAGLSGSTACGAIVEYGNVGEIALAVADLVRHPRDPAVIRARAKEFSFPAFAERLRQALS
jgi:glycosyltransferase involved in cell wall biosynthesis